MLFDVIQKLGEKKEGLFTAPQTLTKAVKRGILDAPHPLDNSEVLRKAKTRIIQGVLRMVDEKGRVISEWERLQKLGF
ncbi:MAG: hypothetical protein N2Z84_03460 [Atribacterota bacterium]|nr:hypothetical protein [Atribacterota bacterium]